MKSTLIVLDETDDVKAEVVKDISKYQGGNKTTLFKTLVVNVRVSYIRPLYKNLKEWCKDSKNVYIGRAGIVFVDKERFPKQASIWANPYKIGKNGTREEVLKKYEKYIRKKIKNENLQEQLLQLKGKNLGCWCHPEACHGDILVKLIEQNLFF